MDKVNKLFFYLGLTLLFSWFFLNKFDSIIVELVIPLFGGLLFLISQIRVVIFNYNKDKEMRYTYLNYFMLIVFGKIIDFLYNLKSASEKIVL